MASVGPVGPAGVSQPSEAKPDKSRIPRRNEVDNVKRDFSISRRRPRDRAVRREARERAG
jgi:hypothetical protein